MSDKVVTFGKDWFNPLYFILEEIIKDHSIRNVLVYGGKSSSKTISVCQNIIRECYVTGASAIAYRKESSAIPTTIKESYTLSIKSMYLDPVYETQDRRYLCENRKQDISKIVLKGIDDAEKAKGIESFKFLHLDELNQFTLDEYEQFDMSLRGMVGQKIFCTWNPVDIHSWVKVDLVDKTTWTDSEKWKLPSEHSFIRISACGRMVLIKTSYEDNYWIAGSPCGTYGFRDDNLIAKYNALKERDFNRYKINVLGEWGKVNIGGEFLKKWKPEKHLRQQPYNPELAIYLSFDENVNPYFPCGIFQISQDEKEAYLIGEVAAKNPNNTVKAMCAEISRKLRIWGHNGKVVITGDATSQKDDVKQEKGHNFFTLLASGLSDYKPSLLLGTSNPSVKMSAEFLNDILAGDGAVSFYADLGCRTAMSDYENTKEDKNGGVDKKTVTDPLTNVSYQPYGHFVDLTRYFFCFVFASEYAKHQRGGRKGHIATGKSSHKNGF